MRLVIPVLLIAVVLSGCSCEPDTPKYDGAEVIYEVKGTAMAASITMTNNTGGTEQISRVYLPWSIYYDEFHTDFLYISAQNKMDVGTITTNIYYNGVLVKSSTSKGSHVISTSSFRK